VPTIRERKKMRLAYRSHKNEEEMAQELKQQAEGMGGVTTQPAGQYETRPEK
jgi:hypothetical protein